MYSITQRIYDYYIFIYFILAVYYWFFSSLNKLSIEQMNRWIAEEDWELLTFGNYWTWTDCLWFRLQLLYGSAPLGNAPLLIVILPAFL